MFYPDLSGTRIRLVKIMFSFYILKDFFDRFLCIAQLQFQYSYGVKAVF